MQQLEPGSVTLALISRINVSRDTVTRCYESWPGLAGECNIVPGGC